MAQGNRARHGSRGASGAHAAGAPSQARSGRAVGMNPYVSTHGAGRHSGGRRTVVGIVVLAVIVCVLAAGGFVLWNLAKATSSSSVGDDTLSAAISNQAASPSATDDEVSTSMDAFTNVLVLVVDDVSLARPTLSSALIASADSTAGTAKVAELPLDAKVSATGQETTLATLFDSQGEAACVGPVADACGLTFAHVVVIDASALAEAESMGSLGATEMVQKASTLLSRMRTDMGTAEIVDLIGTVARMGSGSTTKITVPTESQTLSDGTQASAIDARQLGLALGTLVHSTQA